MRGALSVLLLAAAFLATPAAADPPADAFCVILIEPLDGFRLVRYTIDEETNLTQRAELWPAVDRDNDARITLAEADRYRQSQVKLWVGEAGLGPKAVTLTPQASGISLETQKALFATTWRQVGHVFHQQDYRLPDTLTRTVELETQEVREFRFDPHGDPERMVLSGGRDLNLTGLPAQGADFAVPRPVIEYVVLRAPAPWVIESVTGHTYNGTFKGFYNATSVDLPAFDTKAPYSIVYANPLAISRNQPDPASFRDLGAAGSLGVAFAVLGAAFAARRRGT